MNKAERKKAAGLLKIINKSWQCYASSQDASRTLLDRESQLQLSADLMLEARTKLKRLLIESCGFESDDSPEIKMIIKGIDDDVPF